MEKLPKRKRILIVTNDGVANDFFCGKLSEKEFEVDGVDGGEKCLAIFDPTAHCLVISDLALGCGKMNGLSLAREIRIRSGAKRIPIILLHFYPFDKIAFKTSDDPFDEVLKKPVSVSELLTVVKELLG